MISMNIDVLFVRTIRVMAWLLILLVVGIFLTLLFGSLPALNHFGFSFLSSSAWNPVTQEYGALSFIVGTLLTSFIALLIAIPFSISVGIVLGEIRPRGKISQLLSSLVELLAGIPSVIYGFWALFYLVPIVREIQMKLGIIPYGVGIFTAALILAIMIIPYIASISREVIRMVNNGLKEGAYALGATHFEVIKDVVLPSSKSGILAGIILGLGRAMGETMAVTMVIGNTVEFPDSLFGPGNTIASVIANEFAEAHGEMLVPVLTGLGLILFIMSVGVNILGKWIVRKMVKL
jgi:phosphate transport system permease protein